MIPTLCRSMPLACALLAAAATLRAEPVNFQSLLRTDGLGLDFAIDVSAWDTAALSPLSDPSLDPALYTEYAGGSGLGTITVTITRSAGASGVLSGSVSAFFDFELDEAVNTFFNEYGTTAGVLGAAGGADHFEIDEPGFVFGDIYDNFDFNALDDTNSVSAASPDDVSVALGWDFSLADGESAILTLVISDSGVLAGAGVFSVGHVDDETGETITFSGALAIDSPPEPDPDPDPGPDPDRNPIPEPGTWLLLGIGSAGLLARRKR